MTTILAPDDEWIAYIAQMWMLGSRISKQSIGEDMDGSLADLERLQRIIDGKHVPSNKTQELQALGIIFGKVFVNETPDFDWWVVDDEYGKDACIRYKETSLLSFPQSMLSKRIEDDEEVDVLDLFDGLRKQLERVRIENYPNA